jgi:DNA repair exonuclease SbcCD nuclease subunit
MRVVCCSDAHLDWRTAGVERFDEVRESFEQAVSFAIEEKPKTDLFAFCGDLCDSDNGLDVLRATAFVVDAALKLGICGVPSVWVCGNHDICGDGRTTTLTPLRAAALRLRTMGSSVPILVATEGCTSQAIGGVEVLALPYSPRSYDAEKALLDAGETAAKRNYPLLVFSHLMLPDMHAGSESGELARGKDRMFPLDAMRAVKPALVVSGHYHRAQTTKDGIRIPGALARLTFGEEDHTPSFLVIDDADGFRKL